MMRGQLTVQMQSRVYRQVHKYSVVRMDIDKHEDRKHEKLENHKEQH